MAFVALCSCEKVESIKPGTYTVAGKVEKGPFIQGSTINMATMDDKLAATGKTYTATITDDAGSFNFGAQEFDSQYARLTASGYFFNEVRGELSKGILTLTALVDLSDKQSVNVNILTHLSAIRLQKLISQDGLSFKDAYSKAHKELLSEFGFAQMAGKDPSQFTITAGTDEASALIIISCLLQMDRSEAEITEYLSKLATDFAEDGAFSEQNRNQITKDRLLLFNGLPYIEENIVKRYSELGIFVSVKDLASVADWDGDGVIGNETLKEGESVKLSQDHIEVPAEGGTYTVTIDSPISVFLEVPSTGGEIIVGPPDIVGPGFLDLYEGDYNGAMDKTVSLLGNTLTIVVRPAQARIILDTEIPLYDLSGNQVASVKLKQKGSGGAALPSLSENGKMIIMAMMEKLTSALSLANEADLYYTCLKQANGFKAPLVPASSHVYELWSRYYSAIGFLNQLKQVDASALDVYGPYFDIYSAILYYNLAVCWGDVPFVAQTVEPGDMLPRTPLSTIWTSLESILKNAVEYAEEKKNVAVAEDMNDALFLSKDVARIILADIYMYQGKYEDARLLLQSVFDNGFYVTESPLQDADRSGDAILALYKMGGTKASVAEQRYTWVFCHTDVVLSLAECYNRLGNAERAKKLFNIVGRGINGGDREGTIEDIKNARAALMLPGYFAFLKRNGIAQSEVGYEEYQLLWPIPSSELNLNYLLTQNPGY